MIDKSIIIYILITALIIYIYFVDKICNSEQSLRYYKYNIINSNNIINPNNIINSNGQLNNLGLKIVIMSGTHGNETSGIYALYDLMDSLNTNSIKLKRGELIIIPEVNYCASKLGFRFIPFIGDLNRKYPHKNCPITNKIKNKITNKIINIIKDADFVLDFHDGWGFHRINKDSMGSTISPTDTETSYKLAHIFQNKINNIITDDNKKFNIFTNNEKLLNQSQNNYYSKENEIKGSLRYYMNILNKNYILIETSGQNDIQSLDIRKSQCKLFIMELLKYYDFIL